MIQIFNDISSALQKLGRAITPDMVMSTRELIAPHLEVSPVPDVNIARDCQYGEHERHRLDIFTPAEAADHKRPLLVFVHGGGFVMGDKHTEGTPFYDNVGHWAVRNGFNAVTLTYRLAPEYQWPAGIEDLHAAVQWLQKEGDSHGISADKLFLVGQSAGACHVASYITRPDIYAPNPVGVSGAVLLSGLYNFTAESVNDMEKSYLGGDAAHYADRSSLQALSKTDIPLLVGLSEWDPENFQEQSLNLLNAILKEKGGLPQSVMLNGQNHISPILYLGLPGDVLAPALMYFVQQHG